MTMTSRGFFCLSFIAILLNSCSTVYVDHSDLANPRLQDTQAMVKGQISAIPELKMKLDSAYSGIDVSVSIYRIEQNSTFWMFVFIPYYMKRYQYIAYAFADDKLLYWGSPDEFKKSTDKNISKIGEKISLKVLNNM